MSIRQLSEVLLAFANYAAEDISGRYEKAKEQLSKLSRIEIHSAIGAIVGEGQFTEGDFDVDTLDDNMWKVAIKGGAFDAHSLPSFFSIQIGSLYFGDTSSLVPSRTLLLREGRDATLFLGFGGEASSNVWFMQLDIKDISRDDTEYIQNIMDRRLFSRLSQILLERRSSATLNVAGLYFFMNSVKSRIASIERDDDFEAQKCLLLWSSGKYRGPSWRVSRVSLSSLAWFGRQNQNGGRFFPWPPLVHRRDDDESSDDDSIPFLVQHNLDIIEQVD